MLAAVVGQSPMLVVEVKETLMVSVVVVPKVFPLLSLSTDMD